MRRAALTIALLSVSLASAARASSQSTPQSSSHAITVPEPRQQQIILVAPRVLDIDFEGADATGLAAYVTVDKGAPLDLRDVRDSVRALHGSGRFAAVSAYAEDIPQAALPQGWSQAVRIVFVLTPIRKLTAVIFVGHKALSEPRLVEAANLAVNTEYQADAIPRAIEAIRSAYYRIGYREVAISPETADAPGGGVQLTLNIQEGEATHVEQVLFTGQLGLTRDQLLASLELSRGNVLNLSELDDGLRGVRARYRSAGYLRARVGEPQIESLPGAKARIRIPVESGAPVHFLVRGNRAFKSSLLLSKLGLSGEESLDAQSAQDLANRLRNFYVQNGFPYARTSWREQHGPDGSVEIAFAVEENARLRIEQIEFTGAEGIPDAQLRELMLTQLRDAISSDPAYGADMNKLAKSGIMGRIPAGPPRIEVDADAVYDPILYARARAQMTDLYKSLGYLSARVDPELLQPLDGKPLPGPALAANELPPLRHAKAVIPIVAGLRTKVEQIVVEGGAPDVPSRDVDAVITLHKDKPFSYLSAEEGRAAINAVFTKRGYFYCKVEDEEEFNQPAEGEGASSTVVVRYRIQPGPIVRVAYVEVTGQQHTQESLILELVAMKPGDILTPEGIDKAQQQLLLTGLFFSATLTPRNPEVAEAEKTVLVTLRERPRREVQASAGFSYADGPRAQVQLTQGNLFGRNLTFTALAKVNFPYSRYLVNHDCHNPNLITNGTVFCPPFDPLERLIDVGLQIPRLDPLTDLLRASIDLIHQRAVQYTYNLTKYSAQAAVALNRSRPFGVGLAYEVGFQQLSKGVQSLDDILAATDQRIFQQPNGNLIFGSLRPTVTLDLRDDPGIPRSGFFAQISADYFRSLIGSSSNCAINSSCLLDVNLLQVQGLAAFYVPLPLRSSILFRGRVGRVYLLGSSQLVPGDRRFYLGGAATLRGFNQDALQPQDLRDALRQQVDTCNHFVTGVACTTAVQALQAGAASNGGNEVLSLGTELRIPFYQSLEIALFYDAGNLWSVPISFTNLSNIVLRDAVGVGLRYGTPIGRLAVDLGVNLNPDTDLGEPRVGFYFNIDTL